MSGSMDVGYLPTYLRAEDLGNCDPSVGDFLDPDTPLR